MDPLEQQEELDLPEVRAKRELRAARELKVPRATKVLRAPPEFKDNKATPVHQDSLEHLVLPVSVEQLDQLDRKDRLVT